MEMRFTEVPSLASIPPRPGESRRVPLITDPVRPLSMFTPEQRAEFEKQLVQEIRQAKRLDLRSALEERACEWNGAFFIVVDEPYKAGVDYDPRAESWKSTMTQQRWVPLAGAAAIHASATEETVRRRAEIDLAHFARQTEERRAREETEREREAEAIREAALAKWTAASELEQIALLAAQAHPQGSPTRALFVGLAGAAAQHRRLGPRARPELDDDLETLLEQLGKQKR